MGRLEVLQIRSVRKTFSTGYVRTVKEVFARCVCGREKWIRHEHVKGRRVQSCGCLNYEPRCKDPTERAARRYRAYARNSAKVRGLTFDLDLSTLRGLIFQLCFYCEEKPTRVFDMDPRPYAVPTMPCHGLDRLDSSKGYTLSNVVPCCFLCNMMKWNSTPEDFLLRVEKVAARAATIRDALQVRLT